MLLQDWTPVNNPVLYPDTKRQAVPPWNPPPDVWGFAENQHHRSGSGILEPAPLIPLTFTGCTPATGSYNSDNTLTITGSGFSQPGTLWIVVETDNSLHNDAYADDFTVVSDTEVIATFLTGTLYSYDVGYLVGGYIDGSPLYWSATALFTATA